MRHGFDSVNGARVQHGDDSSHPADARRDSATPTHSAACESSTGDEFANEMRWFRRFVRVAGEPLPEIPS
jgi:hypothetical protein